MGVESSISEVYNNIGNKYTSEHETVRYFSAIEQWQLQAAILVQAVRINKKPNKLKILNVGSGDGSQWECSTNIAIVEEKNYYELDISDKMLDNSESDKKIRGNALKMPFKKNSFDIIIAGLCDHLEPETFFEESYRVLKHNGALAVTYPYKTLMDTIRKKIYKIDPKFTSYDGKHLIKSYASMPKDVSQYYKNAEFSNNTTQTLNGDNWMLYYDKKSKPSNTIVKAAKILRKNSEKMPILVFGFGVKGNEYLGNANYVLSQNQCGMFEDFFRWPKNFYKLSHKRRPWDGLP